jgi:hypothetical protein
MTEDARETPDSPVKPQVIELAAEDVTEVKDKASEPPAEPEPVPEPEPEPPRRRGMKGFLVAALLLGAVGGGWIYRDLLSTYFPSSAIADLQNRMGALEANNKELLQQLAAASDSASAGANAFARFDQSVKDLAGSVSGTADKINGLDQRLTATETAIAAAKADLSTLRNALSTSGTTAGGSIEGSALAALVQRIDALEKDVVSLKSGAIPSGNVAAAAALSQSLADLKAKIATGSAYPEEYDRIARMVPAAPGLDVLAAYAAKGLPTAQGLARELHDLAPTLPAPETPAPPENPSYLDQIWDSLTSIITIRDTGVVDWRGLAESVAATADTGDLAAAVAAVDAAEGTKPAGLDQWRDRAAARLKLEKAVEEAAGAVLRQITALGGVK